MDRTRSKTYFSSASTEQRPNSGIQQAWATKRVPFKVPQDNEVF